MGGLNPAVPWEGEEPVNWPAPASPPPGDHALAWLPPPGLSYRWLVSLHEGVLGPLCPCPGLPPSSWLCRRRAESRRLWLRI